MNILKERIMKNVNQMDQTEPCQRYVLEADWIYVCKNSQQLL